MGGRQRAAEPGTSQGAKRKEPGPRNPWSKAELAAIRAALASWFATAARSVPWRETDDPYAILISEMMLQQTRVETVLAGSWYGDWLDRFPDAVALANASEEQVLATWQGLGYYSRARNLQRAATMVVAEHGGRWPRSAAALRELPGIGEYTAAAVASLAFDEAVATVDGNVIRVLARVGNFDGRIDRAASKRWFAERAEAWLPAQGPGRHNAALMEFGQRICTPKSPRCGDCPLRDWCQCCQPESLPVRPPRRQPVDVIEHALWAVRSARCGPEVLLAREGGSRRRGFWRLPLREEGEVVALELIFSSRYVITHHRVDYRIHIAGPHPEPREDERWWPLVELMDLPITAPARRVIERLGGIS